ncbi:hypothetical protein K1T71_015078 [Dendrolimus kikuchii]|nr:hypothetical protein K1T71_015078 [Dendrolimus kikuchii]
MNKEVYKVNDEEDNHWKGKVIKNENEEVCNDGNENIENNLEVEERDIKIEESLDIDEVELDTQTEDSACLKSMNSKRKRLKKVKIVLEKIESGTRAKKREIGKSSKKKIKNSGSMQKYTVPSTSIDTTPENDACKAYDENIFTNMLTTNVTHQSCNPKLNLEDGTRVVRQEG